MECRVNIDQAEHSTISAIEFLLGLGHRGGNEGPVRWKWASLAYSVMFTFPVFKEVKCCLERVVAGLHWSHGERHFWSQSPRNASPVICSNIDGGNESVPSKDITIRDLRRPAPNIVMFEVASDCRFGMAQIQSLVMKKEAKQWLLRLLGVRLVI